MLLLHKGNQVADEITEAAKHWNFTHTTTQSITDISASIVTLTQVSEKP